MAQCKVNKILIVCEKWKRKSINSDQAMQEIQNIIDLKESEMPSCTCKTQESNVCSMAPKEHKTIPTTEKSGSCHTPRPMTINPFFNFMKELRETTCFNKSVTELAMEAGDRWSKMSYCDKAKYVVEAYKVSRKKDGEPKSKMKRNN